MMSSAFVFGLDLYWELTKRRLSPKETRGCSELTTPAINMEQDGYGISSFGLFHFGKRRKLLEKRIKDEVTIHKVNPGSASQTRR